MTEFVVVVPHDAIMFNEVFQNFTGTAGYFVANNIYSKLVVYGSKSRAVFPDLAAHWETLEGARRFRFYLTHRAVWHDGVPVTAHDVVYSHSHALENNYHAAKFLRGVADIVEVDRHVVEYRLREPNAGFYTQLGNFVFAHVLPAHLYEGTDWALNPHNLQPVGSGPFRFVDWVPGEKIVLEAAAEYWGPPAGVDRIVLRVVPDNDEALGMVRSGAAHYVVQDVATPDRLRSMQDSEHAVVYHERGPGVTGLGFNYRRDPWKNKAIRTAIAHAIDRSRLDGNVTPGFSKPYDHFLPESIYWAFNGAARAPEFDLRRANEILDESGFGRGPDGKRMKVDLKLLKGYAGHDGMAQFVSRCLDAAGVVCRVIALPAQEWAREVGQAGDFDLMMIGGNMEPDPEITASRFESGGGRNSGALSEPEADAAYAAARSTVDQMERGRHYMRLQEVWAREVSWIPLFRGEMTAVRSPHFFGWSDQIDSRVPYWHWGRIRPV